MSKKINTWVDLEDYAVELLKNDRPKKPNGSGNAKKEEDVISSTCIVQCKQTANASTSIKETDINRLLESANLFDKLPVFMSATAKHTILSIIITDENENLLKSLINIAVCQRTIDVIRQSIKYTDTVKNLNDVLKEIRRIEALFREETNKIKLGLLQVKTLCDAKYDNLTIVDLFEGEKNGTK
jgi:hypothetical protein